MPTGVEIVDLSGKENKIFQGFQQNIVSRIIEDKAGSLPKFQELEILPSVSSKLIDFLESLSGSLVISGSTGSGKSVLLQIFLSLIAKEDIKIHTLEDPIEYINPLIVQTQISKKWNFEWIDGLQALMRQDPDVIMVGEIREEEVALLALEAATT
jgi:type II secretory ATPase GspE/PulE/Tfp pilus assembly ATPase PilB-like protein